jgi:serine/threonine-protein kinase
MEGRPLPATLSAEAPAIDGRAPARSLRFAGADGGFESELDAHVQERLRIATKFIAVAVFALFVAGRIAVAISRGSPALELSHPSVRVHLAGLGVALASHWVLRRGRLHRRTLRAMDAVLALAAEGVCVLIYLFSYRTGSQQTIPLLGLLLIARAVVVPCRPLGTFLLSLPAMPAVLAVQLVHGEEYGYGGELLRQESFAATVIWGQTVLGLSVAVATLASMIQFSLRVRAWEAKQVDRYILEERIGTGAMGEVYRARHGLMRRPTAIKVLRPEISGERNLARFEQEVRQTARLTHPNTIAIYDYGTTDEGHFYYAMELLDGADLERVVVETGPLPAARVLVVLEQVCAALAEAHGIGLIHRDLKPANIVLCRRGGEADVVKVMDFGLVMDLRDGADARGEEGIAGTPLTMAPEMIRRAPLTPAADLYAVGAVGCWLLTGRPLFDAVTAADFMVRHLREEPAPPSSFVPGVPEDLERILLRCLSKDPAGRPPSAAALRAELRLCSDTGRWTPEDARGWWAANGARVVPPGSPP